VDIKYIALGRTSSSGSSVSANALTLSRVNKKVLVF
jgi:hypothetical protein